MNKPPTFEDRCVQHHPTMHQLWRFTGSSYNAESRTLHLEMEYDVGYENLISNKNRVNMVAVRLPGFGPRYNPLYVVQEGEYMDKLIKVVKNHDRRERVLFHIFEYCKATQTRKRTMVQHWGPNHDRLKIGRATTCVAEFAAQDTFYHQ